MTATAPQSTFGKTFDDIELNESSTRSYIEQVDLILDETSKMTDIPADCLAELFRVDLMRRGSVQGLEFRRQEKEAALKQGKKPLDFSELFVNYVFLRLYQNPENRHLYHLLVMFKDVDKNDEEITLFLSDKPMLEAMTKEKSNMVVDKIIKHREQLMAIALDEELTKATLEYYESSLKEIAEQIHRRLNYEVMQHRNNAPTGNIIH